MRKTNDKGQVQVLVWVDAKDLESLRSNHINVSALVRNLLADAVKKLKGAS